MTLGEEDVHRVVEEVEAGHAVRQPQRLVLPLVAQHDVHVPQRQGRQRLLGLRLDELAAQPRRALAQRLHCRQRQPDRHRLEARDPGAALNRSGGRRQVGLGKRGPLQQRLRVLDEDERGVGEPHAAAGPLEQGHARLALQ